MPAIASWVAVGIYKQCMMANTSFMPQVGHGCWLLLGLLNACMWVQMAVPIPAPWQMVPVAPPPQPSSYHQLAQQPRDATCNTEQHVPACHAAAATAQHATDDEASQADDEIAAAPVQAAQLMPEIDRVPEGISRMCRPADRKARVLR